jgi:hypothetical protein
MLRATQLVGFGAGEGLSFIYVTHGVGTDTPATIPTARQAGDFCLIFNDAGGGTALVTPSGFTQRLGSTTSPAGAIFSKELDGTETTVSVISGSDSAWVVLVLRPSGPISSVSFTEIGDQHTAGDPALQNITVSGAATPLLIVAKAKVTVIESPDPTASPDDLVSLGGGDSTQECRYKIYNPEQLPANHTWNMVDKSTQSLSSGYFQFS